MGAHLRLTAWPQGERLIDDRWAARIAQLVQPPAEELLPRSVFEIIRAEGFEGSYQTVVRYVRAMRGPRFRAGPAVSVPIETAPAEECQFDFSDCSDWTRTLGAGRSVVLRVHLVLVALAAVVVHGLGRPGAHLRGAGPFLSRQRVTSAVARRRVIRRAVVRHRRDVPSTLEAVLDHHTGTSAVANRQAILA